MLSKKYLVLFAFILVIGGVVGLTWMGSDSPSEPAPTPPPSSEGPSVAEQGYTSKDLPSGVNLNGVISSFLVGEHSDILASSTFEMRIEAVEETTNNPRRITTVYQKGVEGAYVKKSANGEPVREQYFDAQNGTLYTCDATRGSDCPTSVATASAPSLTTENLEAVFEAGDWAPNTVDESGAYSVVGLAATGLKDSNALSKSLKMENVSSFEGEAHVDERQVITAMNATMTGDLRGQRTTFTYRTHVEAVNQTTVTRPEWASTGAGVTRRAYGIQGDNRTMYVTNPTSANLPAGATVTVYADVGDTYRERTYTLDEPVFPEGTVYLTLVDGELSVYNNEIPTHRGDVLTADAYAVRIELPGEGTEVFFEELPWPR